MTTSPSSSSHVRKPAYVVLRASLSPARRGVLWAVAIVAGLGVAVPATRIAQLETHWIVYLCIAQLIALVTLATNVRFWLLTGFIFAIQLNVHYYFVVEPALYVGQSGPNGASIALITLAALALLLYETLAQQKPGAFLIETVRAVPRAVWVLFVAMCISAAVSSVRKFGVYAIVEFLQFVTIYIAAAVAIRSRRELKLAVGLLFVALGVQTLVGALQSLLGTVFTPVGDIARSGGGAVRVAGTIGTTPSTFGAFMEPLLYMCAATLLVERRKLVRIGLALLLISGTAVTLLTLNRTTWGSLPLGFFLTVILVARHPANRALRTRLRRRFVAALVAVIVAGTVALPVLSARLQGQDLSEDFDTRLNLVYTAVAMIRANPILGVGPGGYSFHMQRYAVSSDAWTYIVHNEYLLVLADIGVFGFGAWLLWYLGGLRKIWAVARADNLLIAMVATGWYVGLITRLWYWLFWSAFEFCGEAEAWLLMGLAASAQRVLSKRRVGGSEPSPV